MRRLVIRKIIRMNKALKTLNVAIIVSVVMTVIGLALYFMFFRTTLVFIESLLWLMDGLTYFTLLLAFRIAASRTIYGARYELLRAESLGVLAISVTAFIVVVYLVCRTSIAVVYNSMEYTPVEASIFFFTEAITSFYLSKYMSKVFNKNKLRPIIATSISRKLTLDLLAEAGGGMGIIISNILNNHLIELGIILTIAVYTLYELSRLIMSSALYLIGVGPRELMIKTKEKVMKIVEEAYGRKPRRLLIRMFGTFSEVEVWLEAPPNMSIGRAYRRATRIARRIIINVPEVLRALVIIVPERKITLTFNRTLIRLSCSTTTYRRQLKS